MDHIRKGLLFGDLGL